MNASGFGFIHTPVVDHSLYSTPRPSSRLSSPILSTSSPDQYDHDFRAAERYAAATPGTQHGLSSSFCWTAQYSPLASRPFSPHVQYIPPVTPPAQFLLDISTLGRTSTPSGSSIFTDTTQQPTYGADLRTIPLFVDTQCEGWPSTPGTPHIPFPPDERMGPDNVPHLPPSPPPPRSDTQERTTPPSSHATTPPVESRPITPPCNWEAQMAPVYPKPAVRATNGTEQRPPSADANVNAKVPLHSPGQAPTVPKRGRPAATLKDNSWTPPIHQLTRNTLPWGFACMKSLNFEVSFFLNHMTRACIYQSIVLHSTLNVAQTRKCRRLIFVKHHSPSFSDMRSIPLYNDRCSLLCVRSWHPPKSP